MPTYNEVSEFTRNLTNTRLDCGKSIKELTTYDNTCCWWFADFNFIDLLVKLPEEPSFYRPPSLRFQSRLASLPLFVLAGVDFVFDRLKTVFAKGSYALCGKKVWMQKAHHRGRILFTAEDMMWKEVKDYTTGETKTTDAFFDSLLKETASRDDLTLEGTYPLAWHVHPFGEALRSFGILWDRLRNWGMPFHCLDVYLYPEDSVKEYRVAKHFANVWKTLGADDKFRRLCVLNGADIFELVRRKMKFYFLIFFPYMIKRLSAAERMLSRLRPELVLLISEYGTFERPLLIAAKRAGIPTLAVQHGNITPLHQGYMHTRDEISPDGSVESPFCPIPDKMAVSGPYFKELLTQTSAYPEDSIVITGQPRYDVLDTLNKRFTAEDILKRYSIDPGKKMVLWTTQSHGMPEAEFLRNLDAVGRMAERPRDYAFVIKQHPREGEEYSQKMRERLGLPRPGIVLAQKDADTLLLIRACDLMITKFSTTAMEALALDKPLLLMNFSGEPDRIDYVAQGVAEGVYEPADLPLAIENLLNNKSDIAEKRKEYLARYLYKIDGKATSRIIQAIDAMIQEKGR